MIEDVDRILNQFDKELSTRATRDLESLGVQICTLSHVTAVDEQGVLVANERIDAATVLWAAGVQAASIGQKLGVESDPVGRVKVNQYCNIPGHDNVFVCGDMARFELEDKTLLPGMEPVALQQGCYFAQTILNNQQSKVRKSFVFF